MSTPVRRRLAAGTMLTPSCAAGSSTLVYFFGGLSFDALPRLEMTAWVNAVVEAGFSPPLMLLVRIPLPANAGPKPVNTLKDRDVFPVLGGRRKAESASKAGREIAEDVTVH